MMSWRSSFWARARDSRAASRAFRKFPRQLITALICVEKRMEKESYLASSEASRSTPSLSPVFSAPSGRANLTSSWRSSCSSRPFRRSWPISSLSSPLTLLSSSVPWGTEPGWKSRWASRSMSSLSCVVVSCKAVSRSCRAARDIVVELSAMDHSTDMYREQFGFVRL